MANAVVQAEVGKEGKGPAGMTCLVYKAKLHVGEMLNPTSESDSVSVRRAGLKVVPRFGEFCSCCCLLLLPQLA